MSWGAGILVMLAVALLAGMVWYERSRPPAQVVALVAALAALAAAGRIALSPIPNVVPTTDITLISGFALGGPPGFAVGALAALASNFWLGQGPWTPWQMAAWGLTGVLGAALAAITGRRLGRFGLAAACGLAGLAYGALLDLSLMVTYGGEQSLDRFLALSARGIPFNVAHAAGNVVFALLAGPALVRMLARYRRRFEFAWDGRGGAAARSSAGRAVAGAACLLIAVLLVTPTPRTPNARAAPDASAAAGESAAVAWLRAAQNADGGFAAEPGGISSPAMTGWAGLGLEAAGNHPADVSRGGPSLIGYLRKTAAEISTTGDLERTILLLTGADVDPRRFQGHDLVARLLGRRGGDGSWGGQVNPTAFGVLALEAAGRRAGNSRSAAWLRSVANEDRGWGFAPGAASDPDSTGAVIQALAVTGGSRGAIDGGARYLRGAQLSGGGFALTGGRVNAQSTAWAAQGLLAAGVAVSRVRRGGRSPLDYLASLQAADGHYRYSGSSDQTPVWVTGQVLLAVTGRPFPLAEVAASSGATGASAGKRSGGDSGRGRGDPPVTHRSRPNTRGAQREGDSGPRTIVAGEQPEAETPSAPASYVAADDGGSSLPVIAAATLAALVAVGGATMLHRQRRDSKL